MKALTFLFASAAVLAACQSQPTSYKITGTVEEGSKIKDSTLAVITKMTANGPEFIDTAKVEKKQFVFDGKADTTELLSIYFFEEGKSRPYTYPVDFVYENGNITIQCKENSTVVAGTANNDLLNSLNMKNDSISAPLNPIYEALKDTTLSEEERSAKIAEFQEMRRDVMTQTQELYKTFINNNLENVVGYTMFVRNCSSLFTLEEQEAIIAKLPAAYANSEEIQGIKETIELDKKTAVGQKFTDFTMKTPEGKDLSLSEIVAKNKVTLVDFWASWCGPCRAEMPNVVAAYKTFKSKGLEILGVSLDDNKDKWTKAIKDLNITWPQMSDLKGWECEGAKLYNVRGIPSTLLIGQDGTILAKDLRGKELEDKLGELLK